jgi:hypothetical protein
MRLCKSIDARRIRNGIGWLSGRGRRAVKDSDPDFCRRAVAYVKAHQESLPGDTVIRLTGPDELMMREFDNGLMETYVVDIGEYFQFVHRRHLHAAGLTEDELHELAVANLLELASERLEVRSYHAIYVALMRGNFEASLVLADRFWDEEMAYLAPNGFIAAIPARDILGFCDAGSPAGIAEPRALVGRVEAITPPDHPLTPILLRRSGRRWVRYAD